MKMPAPTLVTSAASATLRVEPAREKRVAGLGGGAVASVSHNLSVGHYAKCEQDEGVDVARFQSRRERLPDVFPICPTPQIAPLADAEFEATHLHARCGDGKSLHRVCDSTGEWVSGNSESKLPTVSSNPDVQKSSPRKRFFIPGFLNLRWVTGVLYDSCPGARSSTSRCPISVSV